MNTLGARVWPWVPAGLLLGMLGGLAGMATIAVRDPGFALERDYYKKAVGYDREISQRAENARLGWSGSLEVGPAGQSQATPLTLRLGDSVGPITDARVTVEALRNAAAALVFEARFVEVAPGTYRTTLPLRRGGVWEFRLTYERAGDRMTEVVRREVPEVRP